MRILNRTEFLAMPSGTVYCKYTRMGIMDDLCVKYGSLSNDWYYLELADFDDCDSSEEMFERLDEMEKHSHLIYPKKCDTTARDGLFDDDQLFMVYSDHDVRNIIQKLIETITT